MSTLTVEVDEVADRFKELLTAAEEGNEVFIQQAGESRRVKIVVLSPDVEPTKKRIAGLGAGRGGWIAPDFDDPLPDSFWLGEG